MPPVTNHSTAVLSHSKPVYSSTFCDSCQGQVRGLRYVLYINFFYRICLLCSKRFEFSKYRFEDSIFKFIQGSNGFIFNFPNVLFSGPRIFPHIYFLLFSFRAFLFSSVCILFLLAGSHTQFDLLEHPCCWQKFRFIFFFTFSYADLLCFLFSFCSARRSEELACVRAQKC